MLTIKEKTEGLDMRLYLSDPSVSNHNSTDADYRAYWTPFAFQYALTLSLRFFGSGM
jgi:hypothetical protein